MNMKTKVLKKIVKTLQKPSQQKIIADMVEKEVAKNKEMELMKKAFSVKYGIDGDIRVRPVVEAGTLNTKEWAVLVDDKKIAQADGFSGVYNYLMEGSLSKDEKIITDYIGDLKVVNG